MTCNVLDFKRAVNSFAILTFSLTLCLVLDVNAIRAECRSDHIQNERGNGTVMAQTISSGSGLLARLESREFNALADNYLNSKTAAGTGISSSATKPTGELPINFVSLDNRKLYLDALEDKVYIFVVWFSSIESEQSLRAVDRFIREKHPQSLEVIALYCWINQSEVQRMQSRLQPSFPLYYLETNSLTQRALGDVSDPLELLRKSLTDCERMQRDEMDPRARLELIKLSQLVREVLGLFPMTVVVDTRKHTLATQSGVMADWNRTYDRKLQELDEITSRYQENPESLQEFASLISALQSLKNVRFDRIAGSLGKDRAFVTHGELDYEELAGFLGQLDAIPGESGGVSSQDFDSDIVDPAKIKLLPIKQVQPIVRNEQSSVETGVANWSDQKLLARLYFDIVNDYEEGREEHVLLIDRGDQAPDERYVYGEVYREIEVEPNSVEMFDFGFLPREQIQGDEVFLNVYLAYGKAKLVKAIQKASFPISPEEQSGDLVMLDDFVSVSFPAQDGTNIHILIPEPLSSDRNQVKLIGTRPEILGSGTLYHTDMRIKDYKDVLTRLVLLPFCKEKQIDKMLSVLDDVLKVLSVPVKEDALKASDGVLRYWAENLDKKYTTGGTLSANLHNTLANAGRKIGSGKTVLHKSTALSTLAIFLADLQATVLLADVGVAAATINALATDAAFDRLHNLKPFLLQEIRDPALAAAIRDLETDLLAAQSNIGAVAVAVDKKKGDILSGAASLGLVLAHVPHAWAFTTTFAVMKALAKQEKSAQCACIAATWAKTFGQDKRGALRSETLTAELVYFDFMNDAFSGFLPGFHDLLSPGHIYKDLRTYYQGEFDKRLGKVCAVNAQNTVGEPQGITK
jgi:hypothetical protein